MSSESEVGRIPPNLPVPFLSNPEDGCGDQTIAQGLFHAASLVESSSPILLLSPTPLPSVLKWEPVTRSFLKSRLWMAVHFYIQMVGKPQLFLLLLQTCWQSCVYMFYPK